MRAEYEVEGSHGGGEGVKGEATGGEKAGSQKEPRARGGLARNVGGAGEMRGGNVGGEEVRVFSKMA